jgi:hypothetical protein
MLKKLLKFLFAPFVVFGALIQWMFAVSTPAPVRQARARLNDAEGVKALLDAEEGKEVATPTRKNPGPALLPPAAAMEQARHVIFGVPEPDLSAVLPEVASWIRGMTRDEALAIRRMGRDELEDHVYARRSARSLRPVAYNDPRRQDELDIPGYLDEIVADLAHLRC